MANYGKYYIAVRLLLLKQYLEAKAGHSRIVKRWELEQPHPSDLRPDTTAGRYSLPASKLQWCYEPVRLPSWTPPSALSLFWTVPQGAFQC